MTFRIDPVKKYLEIIESDRVEKFQLEQHLTRYKKGYKYDPRFKFGVWDGKESFFNDGKIRLGLWNECRKFCKSNGFSFEVDNKELLPVNTDVERDDVQKFCDKFYATHYKKENKFDPYEHQVDSVYKLLKFPFCNIEVATRGGKSLIFSTWMFYILKNINPDAKFLLIVPRVGLVQQFYDDVNEYNLSDDKNNPEAVDLRITEVFGSKPRTVEDPNLVIGTYQSLGDWKAKDLKKFDYLVSDEAHGAKAVTMQKLMAKTFRYATGRWGMSGTFPEENTLDYLKIVSVTGPIVNKVEAFELQKKGIISQLNIKAILLDHNDPVFAMNLQRIKSSKGGKDAYDLEKDYVKQNLNRHKFIIDKILSKVKQTTIVLFHGKEYGKELFMMAKNTLTEKEFYYIDGDVKAEERRQTQKDLEDTTKVRILFATFGTFSTGLTVSSLTNVVLAESFKSEQIIIQSIGRSLGLHEEKMKANIIDLVDVFDGSNMKKERNILLNHFQVRKKFYNKRKYPYQEIFVRIKPKDKN